MNRLYRIPLPLILLVFVGAGPSSEAAADDENIIADLRAERFEIQTDRSELRILIYRSGWLSVFGHNHVISSNSLSGDISLGESAPEASFEFAFPVASLIVDEPSLRQAEGGDFPGTIPENDIRGTRKNMLGPKLLDADNHAVINVVWQQVAGEFPDLDLTADVMLRGQSYPIRFPVTVQIDGDTLTVVGSTRLSHADVGLKPFNAALGALKVADEMQIKYRVVALRVKDD